MKTWDVNLVKSGSKNYPIVCVNLPAELSRALKDKGYTAVTIELTPDGILLKPYAGKPPHSRLATAELPDWNGQ